MPPESVVDMRRTAAIRTTTALDGRPYITPEDPSGRTTALDGGGGAGSPLLEIAGVSRSFSRPGGLLGESGDFWAVSGACLSVRRGETLGLVGESGSGKSTLARMAVRLLRPSRGDILLEGRSIFEADKAFQASLPGRLQMVFQDPYSSLNPRLRVGTSIGEALACAGMPKAERAGRVAELLREVGLEPDCAARFPHEFSGGQRQRMALARALAPEPDLVVCDEPVSSLDASVQAQVLNLLKDNQDRLGLSYLFISHDLAVIGHMSDRVAVMYGGWILELGASGDIFSQPLHPYTQALLEASGGSSARPQGRGPAQIQDTPCTANGLSVHPQDCVPAHPAMSGDCQSSVSAGHLAACTPAALCPYRQRCPFVLPECHETQPAFAEVAPGHLVRCLRKS